jgi:hypothetical protein
MPPSSVQLAFQRATTPSRSSATSSPWPPHTTSPLAWQEQTGHHRPRHLCLHGHARVKSWVVGTVSRWAMAEFWPNKRQDAHLLLAGLRCRTSWAARPRTGPAAVARLQGRFGPGLEQADFPSEPGCRVDFGPWRGRVYKSFILF